MRGFDPVLHTDSSAVNADSTLTYYKITYFKIHILFQAECPSDCKPAIFHGTMMQDVNKRSYLLWKHMKDGVK